MTHILVQQQTPDINRHPSASSMEEKELSPMNSSLDNRLFFSESDSKRFLQFLEQLTTETHSPKYHETPLKKPLALTFSKSEQTAPCASTLEDAKSAELDSTVPEVTVEKVEEDPLSEININVDTDRLTTGRRKRRSSFTKTSSNDQTEPLLKDSIETIETANTSENTPSIPLETLSIQDSNPVCERSKQSSYLSSSILFLSF